MMPSPRSKRTNSADFFCTKERLHNMLSNFSWLKKGQNKWASSIWKAFWPHIDLEPVKKKYLHIFSAGQMMFYKKIFFLFFLAPTEAYLIFKLINKSESGYLSLDEFYGKLMLCASLYLNSNILKWYVGWKSSSDVPEYKFAPLLIYISKVNQSAAIAEVVSKKVTRFKI